MKTTGTPKNDAPVNFSHPRERLERRGVRCLSDSDLFSILILPGTHRKISPLEQARKLIDCVNGSIHLLARWAPSDFKDLGLSWNAACNLTAAFELARRYEDRKEIPSSFTCAQDVVNFLASKARSIDYEICWVLSLDPKSKVLRCDEITTGTGTQSLFHPRDFLRPAIRCNATRIILVHNHPSGDATPSQQDVNITQRLKAACEIMNIQFLDHIIIGRKSIPPHTKGFFSFEEAKLL